MSLATASMLSAMGSMPSINGLTSSATASIALASEASRPHTTSTAPSPAARRDAAERMRAFRPLREPQIRQNFFFFSVNEMRRADSPSRVAQAPKQHCRAVS
jgi:hypothetical protein